ncbi:hypothetical protein F5Y10DRAFT_287014 [Nemania abortiva]|nr:hypothetical protein F5Y10DRAFT_287014 [Nemania abortiva]
MAAEVVYLQSRVHVLELVETKVVDDSQPPTRFSNNSRYAKLDVEGAEIMKIVAEIRVGNMATDAILTRHGYHRKNELKNALVQIESKISTTSLKSMLASGAYVFRAVYRNQVVGVAMIVCLNTDFPLLEISGRTSGEAPPFPNTMDLDAVAKYAIAIEKEEEFQNQVYTYLNRHRSYRDIGALWEMAVLGVKEEFKGLNIEKTLAKHALAVVPPGNRVIAVVEPGKEGMYDALGFCHAMMRDGRYQTVKIEPTWAMPGERLDFNMMTYTKRAPIPSRTM